VNQVVGRGNRVIAGGYGPVGTVDRGVGRSGQVDCRSGCISNFGESDDLYESGVRVIWYPDNRWNCCHIKSISLLANVLAKEEAHRQKAYEAFYYGPDEMVYEGSTSNAFFFKGGTLYTHPLTNKVLPGVTRQVLLDCAHALGIPLQEVPKIREDFLKADEVFLASSTREMVAVVKIDQTPIADGRVGPLTKKLHAEYQKQVAKHCR